MHPTPDADSRLAVDPGATGARKQGRERWPWVVGLVGAGLALGPGLRPGSLLNLDLVVGPRFPVPAGVWGLGPSLPQRVPAGLPIAWLSPLIGGSTAWKLAMVVVLTTAFAGAATRCRDAFPIARVGAGVLYAFGPFALTRGSVGHLNVLIVLALVPWALPTLVRPGRQLSRTYLWAVALSLAGSPGGAAAALLVGVGLVADRGRRAPAVLGALALSTVVWLGPSTSVLAAGAHISGASYFPTTLGGLQGTARVFVGGGFWRPASEMGAMGWAVAAGAVVILALAVVGHTLLPGEWRDRGLAAGLVGLGMTLASSAPGISHWYQRFTDSPIGAPFRDSQRSVVLWLAWLAPAAALGATRLSRWLVDPARRSGRKSSTATGPEGAGPVTPATAPSHGLVTAGSLVLAVPAVIGLLLAAPGLWGAKGAYAPRQFPAGWSQVRHRVEHQPGTMLALPWKEYLDLSFADGRRCFNPMPDYMGGDVLSSYDPEFGPPVQEQVDLRAGQVDKFLPSMLAGRRVSDHLRALGVRWVALAHETTPQDPSLPPSPVPGRSDWTRYVASLQGDPGMRRVLVTPSIELWEVRAWSGPARSPSGRAYAVHPVLTPLQRTSAPAGSVWFRAGAPGWMRGTKSAGVTSLGLVRLSGSGGVIWFWPAILLLAADGLAAVGVVLAVRRLRAEKAFSRPVQMDG